MVTSITMHWLRLEENRIFWQRARLLPHGTHYVAKSEEGSLRLSTASLPNSLMNLLAECKLYTHGGRVKEKWRIWRSCWRWEVAPAKKISNRVCVPCSLMVGKRRSLPVVTMLVVSLVRTSIEFWSMIGADVSFRGNFCFNLLKSCGFLAMCVCVVAWYLVKWKSGTSILSLARCETFLS